ncbi:MAG: VWA domain-containing protein, partial [Polyangiaceae bacterium]|nr:VWA domain-containing protein [Polyangiaceae bacterium]
MSFRDPSLLWLLLLVPALAGVALVAWRLRLRATSRFGAPQTVLPLTVGRSTGLRAARALLFITGVAFVVIALAGPQYGSRTRILRKRGLDVVVALDFSKSMLARDVAPNRIDRAKAELGRFLEELAGDRVGLVAFAGETMEFPMTTDYAALQLFLRDLGPYDMPVGGTAIGRALTASGRVLERARSGGEEAEVAPEERPEQIVVLLTDGEDHEGDPVAAARALAEQGVKVYAVGIGSRAGEPIPTYSPDGTWTGYQRDEDGNVVTTRMTEESESTLRQVAEATGGRYFRARQGSVGMDEIRQEMRSMRST